MSSDESSQDDSTDEEDTIRDFEEEAQAIICQKIVPKKSANRYNLVYKTFMKWKDDNKANSIEENILICYFQDLQKKVGPNSLWSVWSMLRKMLNLKHSIGINKYVNLKAILKNNSKGHKPKKSLTLSWDQIMQFMDTADDYIYLGAKVLLIFGICGALRCIEFTNIKSSHVEDKIDKFIVSIHDTKTYIDRSFVIGPMFIPKIKQYISLRPPVQFTDKFFIQYINGKCTRQVMGKNKIGSTPSVIASFLRLENSSKYTGHCFRRTSATLLSNSGANMAMVKQLGGWRSDAVAGGYIADSTKSKNLIFEGITLEKKTDNKTNIQLNRPSTSREDYLDNQIDEVAQLQLTHEDFCDSSVNPLTNQVDIQPDESVHFVTGSKRQLPSVPLRNNNTNNIHRNHFTNKPPIKLSFATLNKKQKIEEKSDNFSTIEDNNNNIQPIYNKDSNVIFENCTINGNIINSNTNNYYKNTNDS